jgi:hypothetical protein
MLCEEGIARQIVSPLPERRELKRMSRSRANGADDGRRINGTTE